MTGVFPYLDGKGRTRIDRADGHETPPEPAELAAAEVTALLEQVREDALRFLAQTRFPPTALRIQVGEVSLELQWQPVATGPAGTPVAEPQPGSGAEPEPEGSGPPPGHQLRAPSVGVFYRCPAPGEAAFVEVGDAVRAGQQVGVVEVMKLMIPVSADRDGTVTEILKVNGAAVEYDEPLITLALDPG